MNPIKLSQSDQNKLKAGLGQGAGKNYSSFLRFTDFSSTGGNFIKRGILIDRDYLFLSDLEYYTFRIVESLKNVIDIREQFPLLPFSKTYLIANQLNFSHPINQRTKEFIIMTSDLLVTYTDKTVVYSVKYSSDLEDKRVLEKLSIEREYWRQKDVLYRIITEEDINLTLAENLVMLSEYYYREDLGSIAANKIEFGLLCNCFKEKFSKRKESIYSFTREFEDLFLLEPGQGFTIFYYLVSHKEIKVDLMIPIERTVRRKP